MTNYWLDYSMQVVEKELILVKAAPTTHSWFEKMPSKIPVCYPAGEITGPGDYGPEIGYAHHLRLTKFGIEAVLKVSRKYHRLPFYVFYNASYVPKKPFWVVIHK